MERLERQLLTAAGEIDPTFGVDGMGHAPPLDVVGNQLGALCTLPDEKLLAVGSSPGGKLALVRWNEDGMLDPTLGGGRGFVITDLPYSHYALVVGEASDDDRSDRMAGGDGFDRALRGPVDVSDDSIELFTGDPPAARG